MKCDKDNCENEAVHFGQGFEPGKEASSRCKDHRWSVLEMRQTIEAHARSRTAWDILTEVEKAFIVEPEAGQRNQVFQALVDDKRGKPWE